MTDVTFNNEGENLRKQVQVNLANFDNAKVPLISTYNALTNAQKIAVLNTLTSWNPNAASPTVARENALFVAIALLYFMVAYLIYRIQGDTP